MSLSYKDFRPDTLLDGFAWPVRFALADALGRCRFEEGDMFYSSPAAYEKPWKEAMEATDFSIQVRFPRSSYGTEASAEGNLEGMFRANWESPVELDITARTTGKTRAIKTTQGRLYSLLWKGDVAMIEDAAASPEIPMFRAAAQSVLENLSLSPRKQTLFAMVSDLGSRLYVDKVRKLEAVLEGKCEIERRNCAEFGVGFCPTLEMVLFHMDMGSEEAENRVKQAFYVPAKNRQTQEDRFRLKTHGVLIEGFALESGN